MQGQRDAKIADLDGAPAFADDYVGRLEVAVDDVAGVHPLGPREERPHEGAHRVLREAASLIQSRRRVQEAVEALARDVVHDEGEFVGKAVAQDAAEADDARVSAGAGLEEAGLAQQRAGLVGLVLVVRVAERLDGDGLARGAVAGLEDDAEHALAKARLPLVVRRAADAPLLAASGRRHRSVVGCAAVQGGGGGRSLADGHRSI